MPDLAETLYGVTLELQSLRRAIRGRLGLMRPASVLAYRGYGFGRRVLIKARVIEARRPLPRMLDGTAAGHLVDSLRRYATHELPNVEVHARIGGHSVHGTTDEEGFLDLWLESPELLPSGWTDVELSIGTETTAASAFVIGHRSEYAVISDVDDTVIDTNVQNRLKRAYALFLAESKTRLPFEGVDAFYRALSAGAAGDAGNAIFYVSSSPWNLYEHIVEFLEHNRIPAGPLLLRDWGFSRRGFAPDGRHGHKLERVEEVLAAIGGLPVVLIGDSGQRDPELYAEVARRHPGRVRAIYIRNVSVRPARRARLDQLARELGEQGVQLVHADDTLAAARHAVEIGLIRPDWLDDVRRERDDQRRNAKLIDRLER
jgi:phosphatidate phosphatase APP1